VLVTLTVLSRAFRVVLLYDAVLLVQELMVAVIVLPLAYITATRTHIVVEVLSSRLPARVQPWLAPLAAVAGLIFFGALAWAALGDLARAWQGATYYEGDLALPEWPGRAVYALGLAMVVWRLLLQLLTDLRRLPGVPAASSRAA
jgi:TRAP-type C4-dicarboxylate transport system permease small subunit